MAIALAQLNSRRSNAVSPRYYLVLAQLNSTQSNAVSPGAQSVRHAIRATRNETWIYQDYEVEILNALRAIRIECSVAGWNGYDSEPVTEETIEKATLIGSLLPYWMPKPDITAESDGEISFSWYKGPEHQFSFSIGSRGVLSFAGVYGSERFFGSTPIGSTLPSVISEPINRLHGISRTNIRR